MAKFKHIKYTKLSPMLLETVPPQWSRHSVARRKTPRARGVALSWRWRFFSLLFEIDFVWSRHLVFN